MSNIYQGTLGLIGNTPSRAQQLSSQHQEIQESDLLQSQQQRDIRLSSFFLRQCPSREETSSRHMAQSSCFQMEQRV